MIRKHWTEENGKHHLHLGTTEAATIFRNQDGGWAFEVTLFHLAKDFPVMLSVPEMRTYVEDFTDDYLADEIRNYERLREVLR